MLVLSRKVGESIVIGDSIVVTVTRVAGNRLTLGIDAPGDVRILRSELVEEDRTPEPALSASDRLRLVAR
jgi:carbon storage regulator